MIPAPFGSRPRLLCSIAVGTAVAVGLPGAVEFVDRFTGGWIAGSCLFLALTWPMMLRSGTELARAQAPAQDDRSWVILLLTLVAAVVSFAAIGWEFRLAKDAPLGAEVAHTLLGAGTLLCSWFVVHTIFAMHYAHIFYGDLYAPEGAKTAGGLDFPGEIEADYLDFAYFSFVVGMTCQVSDVQVSSRIMRRLTLLHGIISFIFNTVLLALTINLAAGLL